jgi:hypothetical protein
VSVDRPNFPSKLDQEWHKARVFMCSAFISAMPRGLTRRDEPPVVRDSTSLLEPTPLLIHYLGPIAELFKKEMASVLDVLAVHLDEQRRSPIRENATCAFQGFSLGPFNVHFDLV